MHSTVGTEDPNIVPMDFKGKLSRACELRRLTNQRELAELARVSKSSLNRWLQGTSTPDVYEAARLADVLKVSLDWMVKDDDQLEPPENQPLPEDEAAVIRFYRSKKAKGELTEDDAIEGMVAKIRPRPAGTFAPPVVLTGQAALDLIAESGPYLPAPVIRRQPKKSGPAGRKKA